MVLGLDPHETEISARYVNTGTGIIENFSLQAAVPKTMTLSMQTASSTTIASGAVATQRMVIKTTTEHAAKPIAMRLKLSWTEDGQEMNEMATISSIS